jgi:hypothetical protein
MNTFKNWGSPFGVENFKRIVTEEKFLDEVMQHPEVMANTKVGSLRISDRKEEFPKLASFIDERLRAMLHFFMEANFNRTPQNVTWSAWVHTCFQGQGLVPHYHMGEEHITSILYLTDSKANLVVRNPLANMVRNWPQDILRSNMGDVQFNPREGDFVMFPTFLDHYVMAAEPDFRVSIAIDWCFE